MTWQEVAQILAVAIACGGVFRRWCLDPLNESIIKLSTMLDRHEKILTEVQVKYAEVDQRARSAHHRIDELAAEVHQKEALP